MENLFDPYKTLLGSEVVDQLFQMAELIKGIKIVHVNSTKEGGGVAEILSEMLPLTKALGFNTSWEVLKGDEHFFECTKMFHNLLQGRSGPPPSPALLKNYEETLAKNAEELRPVLENADIVIIHDPQPLGLIANFPKRKGKWIWRCHIDLTTPSRPLWMYLKRFAALFDTSIFSLEDFVQPLDYPIFIVPPSIDPFSEKNIDLDEEEVLGVYKKFGIDKSRPVLLQVSRFDRFKDPVGVIKAYNLAKKFNPHLQLVLAGGKASDDPEGEIVYNEVLIAKNRDPDIHLLLLPPSNRTINALQRGADIVLQKSIREGFGLTCTEALWKGKPVIGGNTGGLKLQIINHHTGYLVSTPEGAAHRIRQLLQSPQKAHELGSKGKRLVKENFLITRHLREYLTIMAVLLKPKGDRIDLSRKL